LLLAQNYGIKVLKSIDFGNALERFGNTFSSFSLFHFPDDKFQTSFYLKIDLKVFNILKVPSSLPYVS
jgi:hypothetical protein